jgi:hypothetical protein
MRNRLNIILPVLFILNGCIFLLVSTVFYPAITRALLDIQGQSTLAMPDFWDLSSVLGIVRIILIIVGVFLTGFGITMVIIRKRRTLWS